MHYYFSNIVLTYLSISSHIVFYGVLIRIAKAAAVQPAHKVPGPPPLNENMATTEGCHFQCLSKAVNKAGPLHFDAKQVMGRD